MWWPTWQCVRPHVIRTIVWQVPPEFVSRMQEKRAHFNQQFNSYVHIDHSAAAIFAGELMQGMLQLLGAAAAGAGVFGAAFTRPLWFISVGYGAAMSLQSALKLYQSRAPLDLFGKAHLALVSLYGVRLATFVLWRDKLTSYGKIKQKNEDRAARISPGKVCNSASASLCHADSPCHPINYGKNYLRCSESLCGLDALSCIP